MTVATKIALFNSLFLVVLVFGALALPVIYCQEKIYRQLENPETKFAGLEKNVNWWGVWGTVVMLPAMIVMYYMVFKPI